MCMQLDVLERDVCPGKNGAPKPPKAKSSTRRWVCPKCGTIIRSTKDVRVICADCMELFVKAD